MKLHIWVTDEPLSDDADGDQKIYVDFEFVIGNNLHEARGLALELANVVQRHLLSGATPPSPSDPQETP